MPARHCVCVLVWLLLLGLPVVAAPEEPAASLNNSERFHKLLADDWEHFMTEFPGVATLVGYPGQNRRWLDLSPEAIQRRQLHLQQSLQSLKSIDRSQLSHADQLNYDLYRRIIDEAVEAQRFHLEYRVFRLANLSMPLNQLNGPQQYVPRIIALMPAFTVEDYENIIARLKAIPTLLDQTMVLMNQGLNRGLTPPRVTLRDVPDQVKDQLVDDLTSNPLLRPFTQFPDSIPAGERERLTQEALAALREQVIPGYRKLHDYLVQSYIPAARESIGLSELPEGATWYDFLVRHHTTTDLTARRIHEIGLAEVRRIRARMEKVIADIGFEGGFAEFTEFLRTDPRFYFEEAEDLLMAYRDIAKRADPELVKLFGRLPRLPYGVVPVPSYAEKSQTTAYYQSGSLEAGRPGKFFANTYNLPMRPKWEMEALTLHEAVPGHHLQIALAQELEGVPEFRKRGNYTAFIEGWGLYAESLGEEMGFYTDPYSKFGQLTYEMWRAVRLVVDTGMHALGWSREQAIDFFRENTSKTEHDIVVEIDRYIVWPGQALAYKIGALKINELRAHARAELGPAFDVRDFHDEVLGNGPLPLAVLETHIRQWVAGEKANAAGKK